MRRKQWKTEQILQVLEAAKAPGITIKEVCRIYGVAETCFYRWRDKYDDMVADEARRLKELEDENRRLKQLLANRDLEVDALQRVLRKNSPGHSSGGRR